MGMTRDLHEANSLIFTHRMPTLPCPQLMQNNRPKTGNIKQHLMSAQYEEKLKKLMKGKQEWDEPTFHTADWQAVEKARTKIGPNRTTRVVKLMHKWLPTKAQQHKIKEANDPICPRCKTVDEDIRHLLTCGDPDKGGKHTTNSGQN
jgi:DNA-directed RNA polymerase subunit M/transcription elongation factor TFIIS